MMNKPGRGIQRLRRRRGWTEQQLGEACETNPLSDKQIQKFENNKNKNINEAILQQLIDKLDTTEEEVIFQTGIGELVECAVSRCRENALDIAGTIEKYSGQNPGTDRECAIALEEDLLPDKSYQGADLVIPVMRHLASTASYEQCGDLMELVGALTATWVKRLPDIDGPTPISVYGVTRGYSLHILLNSNRGQRVLLSFQNPGSEDSVDSVDGNPTVPLPNDPEQAYQIPPPRGVAMEDQLPGVLLYLNKKYTGFTREHLEALNAPAEERDLRRALKAMDTTLYSLRRDDRAPFAYTEEPCSDFLAWLKERDRLPSLRIFDVHADDEVPVFDVSEEDLELFLCLCFEVIHKRQLEIDFEQNIDHAQLTTVFEEMKSRLRSTNDERARQLLAKLEQIDVDSLDKQSLLATLKRYGSQLSEWGLHIGRGKTVWEIGSEIARTVGA